jgi:hypothetical protein
MLQRFNAAAAEKTAASAALNLVVISSWMVPLRDVVACKSWLTSSILEKRWDLFDKCGSVDQTPKGELR